MIRRQGPRKSLRQADGEPLHIWSQPKIVFCLSQVRTHIRIQEMQKFLIFLKKYQSYSKKTKNGSILANFRRKLKLSLYWYGCTDINQNFRDDKTLKITTFESFRIAKFGHQGALGPLFTFSIGLDLNMCCSDSKGFLFARSKKL